MPIVNLLSNVFPEFIYCDVSSHVHSRTCITTFNIYLTSSIPPVPPILAHPSLASFFVLFVYLVSDLPTLLGLLGRSYIVAESAQRVYMSYPSPFNLLCRMRNLSHLCSLPDLAVLRGT